MGPTPLTARLGGPLQKTSSDAPRLGPAGAAGVCLGRCSCTEGLGCGDKTRRLQSMKEQTVPQSRGCAKIAHGCFLQAPRLWTPSGAGRVQANPGLSPSLLLEKGVGEKGRLTIATELYFKKMPSIVTCPLR